MLPQIPYAIIVSLCFVQFSDLKATSQYLFGREREKNLLNHPKEEQNSFSIVSLCKTHSPTALWFYVNNAMEQ